MISGMAARLKRTNPPNGPPAPQPGFWIAQPFHPAPSEFWETHSPFRRGSFANGFFSRKPGRGLCSWLAKKGREPPRRQPPAAVRS
jgi:hypothetical protein